MKKTTMSTVVCHKINQVFYYYIKKIYKKIKQKSSSSHSSQTVNKLQLCFSLE
jgi:hypothetical protein